MPLACTPGVTLSHPRPFGRSLPSAFWLGPHCCGSHNLRSAKDTEDSDNPLSVAGWGALGSPRCPKVTPGTLCLPRAHCLSLPWICGILTAAATCGPSPTPSSISSHHCLDSSGRGLHCPLTDEKTGVNILLPHPTPRHQEVPRPDPRAALDHRLCVSPQR